MQIRFYSSFCCYEFLFIFQVFNPIPYSSLIYPLDRKVNVGDVLVRLHIMMCCQLDQSVVQVLNGVLLQLAVYILLNNCPEQLDCVIDHLSRFLVILSLNQVVDSSNAAHQDTIVHEGDLTHGRHFFGREL